MDNFYSGITTVTIDPGGNNLWLGPSWLGFGFFPQISTVFTNTGGGTYTAQFTVDPNQVKVTIRLLSTTHAEGEMVDTITTLGCTGTLPFQMDRVDTPTPTP